MNGFLEERELEANYEECRAVTRRYARTFYFASHVLPAEKRRAAYAVYAFCRYADELADGHGSSRHHARQQLSALRDQLRYLYNRSPHMDKRLRALLDTVTRYGIPQEYFLDLLRGVEMDLDRRRFATFAELREYCYCVASTVGRIMTRIFGVADPRAMKHADDLGIAMQLTNILRDIGEDTLRGRCYIPQEDLQRFSYSEDDLIAQVINEQFRRLMQHSIERARAFYRSADAGIPLLTNDGSRFCVLVMRRAYAAILDNIERDGYDVFSRRAFVPTSKKLLFAVEAFFSRNSPPSVRAQEIGFSTQHQG